MKTPRILIMCTGNSCRSQMAEGLLRQAAGDLIEVYSAGTNPVGYVHPLAIEVMAQAGIDLSTHTSKHYAQFVSKGIDTVITVCDEAREAASLLFEGSRHFHWPFGNPPKDVRGSETILDAFRRIRSEISPVFQAYAAGYTQAKTTEETAPACSGHPRPRPVMALHVLP